MKGEFMMGEAAPGAADMTVLLPGGTVNLTPQLQGKESNGGIQTC